MKHLEATRALIGPLPPTEPAFRREQRRHQGWWRAFVLSREPGPYPRRPGQTICNTMDDPRDRNFLTPASAAAFANAIERRGPGSAGLIEPGRARGNLLSSQPMAFNLFGELAADLDLARRWLQCLLGQTEVSSVTAVHFEFRPSLGDLGDNSAFDVALEFRCPAGPGLVGFEVKYTDDFTAKRSKTGTWYGGPGDKNEAPYQSAFAQVSDNFSADFSTLVESRQTNQLFRNALSAELARVREQYAEVHTGLVCHPDDDNAVKAASVFRHAKPGFALVKIDGLIETLQRLELTRAQRAWTSLVWARYLGRELSAAVSPRLT